MDQLTRKMYYKIIKDATGLNNQWGSKKSRKQARESVANKYEPIEIVLTILK